MPPCLRTSQSSLHVSLPFPLGIRIPCKMWLRTVDQTVPTLPKALSQCPAIPAMRTLSDMICYLQSTKPLPGRCRHTDSIKPSYMGITFLILKFQLPFRGSSAFEVTWLSAEKLKVCRSPKSQWFLSAEWQQIKPAQQHKSGTPLSWSLSALNTEIQSNSASAVSTWNI